MHNNFLQYTWEQAAAVAAVVPPRLHRRLDCPKRLQNRWRGLTGTTGFVFVAWANKWFNQKNHREENKSKRAQSTTSRSCRPFNVSIRSFPPLRTLWILRFLHIWLVPKCLNLKVFLKWDRLIQPVLPQRWAGLKMNFQKKGFNLWSC